ncbi:uncharacterized protein KY384_003976 [Bacidia gigantensis]|uniref:uncharacterized protein n=1 Tax=Bacidia gigantensis TaxID=2732470 RepID=UPI001D04DAB2|nr:uncharacterized protein KY384_003976 [Bacidia gigantensis]KAG8532335.1 hypothetical protein KY384_003976 [Bacidia gigantensis]
MGTHGDHQPPSKRPRRESARMQNANAILARDEENPLQPYILHFDDIGLLDPHNLHDIILELSEPFQQSTIWLIFCENAGFKSKISEIYAQWRPVSLRPNIKTIELNKTPQIRGLTIDDIETCRDSTYKNNTVHYRWYFMPSRLNGRWLADINVKGSPCNLQPGHHDVLQAHARGQRPRLNLLEHGSCQKGPGLHTFLEMWQESIKMIEEGNLHETSTLQDSGTMAPEASGRDLKKSPLAPAIHLPLEKVEPSKTNQQLDDIISSLKMVPSNVTPALKDVFGLDHLKKTLLVTIQTIQGRQRHPHLSPPRGLNGFLIFGPPGIGKSVLIAALAKEVSWSFYQINSGSDAPKFAGKTEKLAFPLVL